MSPSIATQRTKNSRRRILGWYDELLSVCVVSINKFVAGAVSGREISDARKLWRIKARKRNASSEQAACRMA